MEIEYVAKHEVLLTVDNQKIIAGNDNLSLIDVAVLEDDIFSLPAADVRPVVKAHWIYHEDDCGDYYECSHCHDEYVVYEGDMCWKFCPTCGAEMKPNLDTTKGERRDESSG